MNYPKKVRYYMVLRESGSSLFVLIPCIIRRHMNLKADDMIVFIYDTRKKTITIRKVKK